MSPIMGLTDTIPSFKEIGRLRKGAPKSEGLKDLKYFRADFRPDETEAAALFFEAYGDQPTTINVRLAFPEIERVWDAWFTCYNTSGMLGMADGKTWHYLRDNKTGQILVRDGQPYKEFDPATPVYSYRSKKGEDVAVYARPEGKLRLLIPELRRANYVTLVTHSWYDCARISGQLAGIAEMAKRIGLSLPLVPLQLTRRPETVSCKLPDGGKNQQEKWLINIDIRPDWAQAQFAMLEELRPGIALPAPAPLPELPSGVKDDDEGEDEQQPQEQQPPQSQSQTNGNGNGARPYTPAQVKAKLIELAKKAIENNWTASDSDRNMIAVNLNACFAGEDDSDLRRHAVMNWLTDGKAASVKDLSIGQVIAFKKWIDAQADSGGEYHTNPMTVREVIMIYSEALKSQGQGELFT